MKLVSAEKESEKKGTGGESQPLPAGQRKVPTSGDAEQPHHAQQKQFHQTPFIPLSCLHSALVELVRSTALIQNQSRTVCTILDLVE